MLTQCPGCQTVFRVTGAILRAAHGQVRCGRCNQQFDAIAHLLDNDALESAEHPAPTSAPPDEDSTGLAGFGHEDIILEGNRIEISGVYDRLSSADGRTHLEHGHIIEEFNIESEQWENPFVEPVAASPAEPIADIEVNAEPVDARLHEDDEYTTEVDDIETELNAVSLAGDIASLDPQAGSQSHFADEASFSATPETVSANVVSPPTRDNANAAKIAPPLLLEPDTGLLPPTVRRWPWLLAAMMLTVLLLGQSVHHWRATLARHPDVGPWLMRVYQTLGLPLTPEWQLDAYNIKQWGIVSDPAQPGTLRVRASVTNDADFAQPYPVLRLTLEDRFGAQVSQRDFKPDEYLGAAPQADRLLASNAAANIDLAIVDPGPDAVGFQFDSCLLEQNQLHCAHDTSLAR